MTIRQYTAKDRKRMSAAAHAAVIQHKMFKKDFKTTTIELLQNYYGDIDYMATETGIYECNNMTNGTPEFFNDQEAHEYLQFLAHFILALKEDES